MIHVSLTSDTITVMPIRDKRRKHHMESAANLV